VKARGNANGGVRNVSEKCKCQTWGSLTYGGSVAIEGIKVGPTEDGHGRLIQNVSAKTWGDIKSESCGAKGASLENVIASK